MYIKGKQNMNNNMVINSKNKFIELLRAINSGLNKNNNINNINDFNEDDIEQALNLIKEKMNYAVKLYNLLYNKEMNILNNFDNLNSNSNFYLN